MKILRWMLVLFVLTGVAQSAEAGRSCEEKPVTPGVTQQALTLALDTQTKLEEAGAQVALMARAGQDLSRYGLHYSHFGFVWRDQGEDTWHVVHQLNLCGTDKSEIFDEGIGNFFLDDLWRMEAVILIPSLETQQRLATVLRAKTYLAFHNAHYNMVAYPFSTRYQNSNQWALEVIAAALARDAAIDSREKAQQWLKFAGYQPTELKLDPLTRLGARVTKANIAFDDHPGELRWSDRIRTVTVDSVFDFMARREPQLKRMVVEKHS